MNKLIVSLIALSMTFAAGTASAQSYYSVPSYSTTYSTTPTTYGGTGCVTVSRDLSFGARGTDVRMLQSFLVNQNYAGGGSWMVTGYFGAATQAAVRIFQSQTGLPQTGIVDATTRARQSQHTRRTRRPPPIRHIQRILHTHPQ